jgi:murein hydrolase activator
LTHLLALSFSRSRADRRRPWILAAAALLAALGTTCPAEAPQQRLQRLQQQIGALRETLDQARSQKEYSAQELADLERRVGVTARALRDLDRDLDERGQVLEQLEGEVTLRERSLRLQRQVLGQELYGAYISGRQERLRLLMSQDGPERVSRMRAYYEYLGEARAARIRETRAAVTELRAVRALVAQERAGLERQRAARAQEDAQLAAARRQRRSVLTELERTLSQGSARLAGLEHDARGLQRLIERLQRAPRGTESGPQGGLPKARSRLRWPVAGRVVAMFGSDRGGGLRWHGMVIAAREGAEVKAVARGRVAFADWLRGFGLLIILDHGGGKMSLYGFNQSLLKETGEWVEQGDAIALVGDSGGRSHPSLYFATREDGVAVDPRTWCRPLHHRNSG